MRRSFSRSVKFSADQMLDLVADVETYPQFIPHCDRMDVKRSVANPENDFNARMHIKFGPISQAYNSHITVDDTARTLRAKATDGPFSHLDSLWTFTPKDGEDGTDIKFEIDFGIANPLLRAVAEPAFAAKQDEILDAFIKEAQKRYS